MKLSIITIVLNDRQNIEKTISSVLSQRVDLEYIIIDGGSTDGTLDVVERYRDSIAVLVSENDDGIVDAFNKGIKKATGDVIGLVNSGDFLESEALKKVSEAFESNTVDDVVYGNVQYWDKNQKEYIYKANHSLLTKFMSVNHPAVFVKKEIYNQYGLFDDTYKVAMDYDLMLRFYSKGAKFKYIDSVLSNMALGGVSDVNWKLAYRESFHIRKKYLGNSVSLYTSYLWQVLKRYVSNTVSKLGLEGIKKFYRTYFSSIKKEKS